MNHTGGFNGGFFGVWAMGAKRVRASGKAALGSLAAKVAAPAPKWLQLTFLFKGPLMEMKGPGPRHGDARRDRAQGNHNPPTHPERKREE